MYGYIYLTTNKINGRKYIGRHKSSQFDESYLGSGKVITQAISIFGKENFTCEILSVCESEDELNEEEFRIIEELNAVNDRQYYNLKPGGIGKSSSGVIYITNGESCKKVFPQELPFFLDNGWVLGGPRQTEETKRKRADSNRGKKHPTAGAKISAALTGRKIPEEKRVNMGKGMCGKPSPTRRRVLCVEEDIEFPCIAHAAAFVNGSSGCICNCLSGRRELAYGYHWKYVDTKPTELLETPVNTGQSASNLFDKRESSTTIESESSE